MNLDLLRSFLAIAEFDSLSQAAEQLHVSQSTLRRQMQTLESDRVSAVPRFNLHRSSLG